MNSHRILDQARSGARWQALAFLAAALVVSQSGCCCFECFQLGAAPLKVIPPKSALEPRNPPCSYIDPLCYGYHATCWRSWPAECDNARDCAHWYQQDVIEPADKGETLLPMAPMPEAPAPTAPLQPTPADQPVPEESSDSQVRPASDYAALPPVFTPQDISAPERIPASSRPFSSRRATFERLPEVTE